jgi:hypothetical protein
VPGTNPAADWKTRRCFWTTCSWFKRWELSAESATRWEDKRGKDKGIYRNLQPFWKW